MNFYAGFSSTSGGAGGLLNGKTLGSILAKAVGLSSNPQQFIESSLENLESLFKENGWTWTIVEMNPALPGRTVSEDPIARQQQAKASREGDRAKRLEARQQLQKLGVDAADQGRFVQAVKAGDIDVVELFLQAGVVDARATDSAGRRPHRLRPQARHAGAAERLLSSGGALARLQAASGNAKARALGEPRQVL